MAKQGKSRSVPEDYNQKSVQRVFTLIKLMKQMPRRSASGLAAVLGTSERTIYRYLNLIESLGFTLMRDKDGHHFIVGAEIKEPFSSDEAQFMAELLKGTCPDDPIARRILSKLFIFNSDEYVVGDALIRASRAQNLSRISEGIACRRRIFLIGYYSANSGSTSNRVVEPIELLAGHSILSAFDVESQTNKYFRVDRMSAVEVAAEPMHFEAQHSASIPDMFGFALREDDEPKKIHLDVSLRTAMFLRTEFPLSSAFLSPALEAERFELKGPVADFRPAARFVRGVEEEDGVRVLGDEAFREYLEVQIALDNLGVTSSHSIQFPEEKETLPGFEGQEGCPEVRTGHPSVEGVSGNLL
jgi:predicted DNA-binding transcriptional regulator YafY